MDREGLPITKRGTIHKRTVQKLSTLTIISQEDFEQLDMLYEHKELYPVHVVILLDMLLCLNLVQQTARGFEIRQDKLQQWIKLSWFEMHSEVLECAWSDMGHWDQKCSTFAISCWCLRLE